MMTRLKSRCERHKKACEKCKYNRCPVDCADCDINPSDNVFPCPCLDVDDSPKGSRCAYFKEKENADKD